LLWLNGLAQDAVVHPGAEVKVRLLPGETPPATPTPQQSHIVQSGDTAWSIALRYGLTAEQLAAFNHISPDALLQIGQELFIVPPTTTPEPTPTPTLPPTDSPVQLALAVTPAPAPRATEIISAATPVVEGAEGSNWNTILAFGALITGVALMVLAGVAILVLWRNN
jgi:hypothetical protein